MLSALVRAGEPHQRNHLAQLARRVESQSDSLGAENEMLRQQNTALEDEIRNLRAMAYDGLLHDAQRLTSAYDAVQRAQAVT